MAGRLIAIGDVHGCSSPLRTILDAIRPDAEDAVVFLGDLINRGPDSKAVVSDVIALSRVCQVQAILGNHEEMLLAAYSGGPSDHKFWLKFGGDKTLASYGVESARSLPGEHLRFFGGMRDYAETAEFIFVHAGCDSGVPLGRNTGDKLRWTKLDRETNPHFSGKTVVCGHSAQRRVLDLGHLLCIDTGCGVWPGGRLTAVDLIAGTVWQAGHRSKRAFVSTRGTS